MGYKNVCETQKFAKFFFDRTILVSQPDVIVKNVVKGNGGTSNCVYGNRRSRYTYCITDIQPTYSLSND